LHDSESKQHPAGVLGRFADGFSRELLN